MRQITLKRLTCVNIFNLDIFILFLNTPRANVNQMLSDQEKKEYFSMQLLYYVLMRRQHKLFCKKNKINIGTQIN